MTVKLSLSDGTNTVALIDTSSFDLLTTDHRGWLQGDPEERQIRRESFFAEGESLVLSQPKNVIETFHLALEGASDNAIATSLQSIETLRRSAIDYHTSEWQRTPVYLLSKTDGETNTRYALVYNVRVTLGQALFGEKFDWNTAIDSITVVVEREPYWRAFAPGDITNPVALTLGSYGVPSNQSLVSRQFIGNRLDTSRLTHIFNYDDSVAAFSGNLFGAALPYDYFSVSGSAPAVNDLVYFGSTSGPGRILVLYIGPSSSMVATYKWEYWNGAAWIDGAAGGIDIRNHFNAPGENFIRVNATDWATTTINGVAAWWIRVKISAFTSVLVTPYQASQDAYHVAASHVTIANTQIDGDVAALARIRFALEAPVAFATSGLVYWLTIATRSRSITNFTNRFNCGDAGNPSEIDVAGYSADTSAVDSNMGAGGKKATTTFASSTALSDRILFYFTSTSIAASYVGRFNVYVRCTQVGGSAGDVSVSFTVYMDGNTNVIQQLPTVPLKTVGEGVELVYIGQINIGDTVLGRGGNYTNSPTYFFALKASALSDTPDLDWFDVILMPADEFSCTLAVRNLSSAFGVARVMVDREDVLDIDSGLVYPSAILSTDGGDGQPGMLISLWEVRGTLPMLRPDTALGIYTLFGTYQTSSNAIKSPSHLGGSLSVITHNRWSLMRGSE